MKLKIGYIQNSPRHVSAVLKDDIMAGLTTSFDSFAALHAT